MIHSTAAHPVPRFRRCLPAVLTLVLGVAASLCLFLMVRGWERARAESEFERRTGNLVSALEKGRDSHLEVLRAIQLLSPLVGRNATLDPDDPSARVFRDFFGDSLTRYPGLQALQFVIRVRPEERGLYEGVLRAVSGSPEAGIREPVPGGTVPAGARAEYFPILYIEPLAGNEASLGIDLAANPVAREGMQRAQDSGAISASGPLTLSGTAEGAIGFLIFLATYPEGSRQAALEERRTNVNGFLTGAVRLDGLMESSLAGLNVDGLGLRLSDGLATREDRFTVVYEGDRLHSLGDGDDHSLPVGPRRQTTLTIAGRPWSLVLYSTTGDLAGRPSWSAWGVLGGGTLCTLLLVAYLLASAGRAAKIERVVRERTAEIATSNAALEREVLERTRAEAAVRESEARFRSLVQNTSDIIVVVGGDGIVKYQSASTERILGYAPEEMLGQNGFTFFHPEDQPRALASFARILGDPKEIATDTLRLRAADGSWRWVEGSAVNLLHDPSIAGIVVNYRDVTERRQAEEALRYSEERFRSLVQNVTDVIAIVEANGIVRYESPSLERALGYNPEELTGRSAGTIVHPEDLVRVGGHFERVAGTTDALPAIEYRMRHKDGSWRHVESIGNNLLADPSVGGLIFTTRDISERRQTEEALRRSEERFRSLVQNVSDIIVVIDATGAIRYVSPSLERVVGYRPEELAKVWGTGIMEDDEIDRLRRHFARVSREKTLLPPIEFRMRHRDGSWRQFEAVATNLLHEPSVAGVVFTCRDVTERKSFEAQLTHQAFHDALTDLPNRTLFQDRLGQALARASRRAGCVAVAFLDLDNFKVINDSLGHRAGDELLVAVSERLQACVRPGDTVARIGGDEFTLLLEEVRGVEDALAAAERIAAKLRAPFSLDGHEVYVTTSIGIAVSNGEEQRAEDLLRNADVAMYEAKGKGKARAEVFDARMDALARERLELEMELRRALERGEFRVHYQPVVLLETGAIREVEALVRWQHPRRGLLSPAEFIPLAEETGLILPIGLWVLETACQQVCAWQTAYPDEPPLRLSVNLSMKQFQHPALLEDVFRALRESGLDARSLTLEITESVAMADAEATIEALQALRQAGICIAIDDFGTGYSGLSYLKRFPVHTLKVDRSFVDGLGHDADDTGIVRAVVALSHTLGLKVTAEGVETAEQAAQLRALGCEQAQGYYFARPQPPPVIASMLAEATLWGAA